MEFTAGEKAAVLVEALPYIKSFYGQTVVVKYGGHAMTDPALKQGVMQDIILMKYVGMNPVLVHGGGPEITGWLARLGRESNFVSGQRVTNAADMEVVGMVLAGKVNKELVAAIAHLGGRAIGLCGHDGRLLEAEKKLVDGQDLGYVGDVTRVNAGILHTLMAEGYIPVVASIGAGRDGESYNINADFVAAEVAGALQAAKLVLLTDVTGVLAEPGNPASLLSSVTAGEVAELIGRGVISAGMIPKVQCCLRALEAGVGRAHIIDGRLPHAILLEIFTNEGIGTMVVRGEGIC
ncbi:MAG: acetylglutamate kinase [Clostridia bacterium]|nr:MAG: acetylglutamate kinase [Clostridia bacterium]